MPTHASNANVNSPIRTWQPVEFAFVARNTSANPYLAIQPAAGSDLLRATFVGTDGDAKGKSITVIGFWDGGQDWKVRFAPPSAGAWRYKTESSDPGLDAHSGDFVAREWSAEEIKANALGRGFVRVCKTGKRPGRYFEYADGTPFLWIADTWWNWASGGPTLDEFREMVDDRARKCFTIGMIFAQGWANPPLDATGTILDVGRMKHLDAMVAYANSRGIAVILLPWWGGKDLGEKFGPDVVRRFARYLMHRFGAFNVMWIPAGEYNMDNYSALGIQFWRDYGAMMKSEDPYPRALGIHPTPPNWDRGLEAPQWSTGETLHDQPWLDYNQIQLGHGKCVNELAPEVVARSYAMKPTKPILVSETWYEFILDNAPARDVRFAAWSAILSGAPGHTYGGGHVWQAHTPSAPRESKVWPLDHGFENNTFDYPGAASMGHIAKFFSAIEWWRLEPHPELVFNYANKLCLARPGEEYVVYLRYGCNFMFDLAAYPGATFQCRWFNPESGEYQDGITLPGGKIPFVASPYVRTVHFLTQPEWVLHLKKTT